MSGRSKGFIGRRKKRTGSSWILERKMKTWEKGNGKVWGNDTGMSNGTGKGKDIGKGEGVGKGKSIGKGKVWERER